MRIIAVSNVDGEVERVVEALDKTDAKILAREISGELEVVVRSVYESLKNNAYDLAVVLPNDYVGACISLNKYREIRAAPCASEDDIKFAFANDANVLIVKQGTRLDHVGKYFEGNSEAHKQHQHQDAGVELKTAHKAVKGKEDGEQEKEYGDDGSGGGSIFGKLKSSLGIVDAKHEKPSKE